MVNLKGLLLGLALMTLAGPAGADPVIPQGPLALTSQEACQLALLKSPRVGLALARLRQAQAEVEVVQVRDRTTGSMTLQGPPIPGSLATIRPDFVLSPVRLEIRKLLFDGGKLQARIEQAQALVQGQVQQAQAEWHQLCLELRVAYLEALRSQAQEGVSQQALDRARKEVEVAQARLHAGEVARADLLLAEVPLSESESDLSRARNRTRDSEDALNRIIGLPLDTRLALADPALPTEWNDDLPAWVALALRQRPALAVKEMELKAVQHGVEAAERETRPRMSVFAGFAALSSPVQVIDSVGYRAGFELSWDFWDGGLSAHLTESAKARQEQVQLSVGDYRQQIEQEVRSAFRAVQLARELFATSQAQLERARDALRISTAQYRAGFVPYAQVRQAQLDLTRADATQVNSHYDYLTASARFDWAVGRTPEAVLHPE